MLSDFVADTADKMATAALELLQNRAKQQSLASQGKKFVQTHYDWNLIAAELDQVYQNLGKKLYEKT